MDILEVKCPDCPNLLIVDRKTGKVLEVRRPIAENTSGDRFEDARRKVLRTHERAEQKFAEAKDKQKGRMAELEKLFDSRKKELKNQPIEKPEGLFDND